MIEEYLKLRALAEGIQEHADPYIDDELALAVSWEKLETVIDKYIYSINYGGDRGSINECMTDLWNFSNGEYDHAKNLESVSTLYAQLCNTASILKRCADDFERRCEETGTEPISLDDESESESSCSTKSSTNSISSAISESAIESENEEDDTTLPKRIRLTETIEMIHGIDSPTARATNQRRATRADKRFFQPEYPSDQTRKRMRDHERYHVTKLPFKATPLHMGGPARSTIIAASAPTKNMIERAGESKLQNATDIVAHSSWKSQPYKGQPSYNFAPWQYDTEKLTMHYTPAPGHLGGGHLSGIGRYGEIYRMTVKVVGNHPDRVEKFANIMLEKGATGMGISELASKHDLDLTPEQAKELKHLAVLIILHEVARRQYPGKGRTDGTDRIVPYLPFGLAFVQQMALLAEGRISLEDVFKPKADGSPAKYGPATATSATNKRLDSTMHAFSRLQTEYDATRVESDPDIQAFLLENPRYQCVFRTEHYHHALKEGFGTTSDSDGEVYSDSESDCSI